MLGAERELVPDQPDPVVIAVPSKTMRDFAPFVMLFGAMCICIPLIALFDAREEIATGADLPERFYDRERFLFWVAMVLVPVGIAVLVGAAIALLKSRGSTIEIGSAGLKAKLNGADVAIPWEQVAAVWILVSTRREWTRYGWRTPVESWIWLSFPPDDPAARRPVPIRLTTLVWSERHDSNPAIAAAEQALRRFAGPRYCGAQIRH